jgi:hypothetical protein
MYCRVDCDGQEVDRESREADQRGDTMSKSKSLSAALAAVFMSVAAASLATTPANAEQKASVGLAKGSQSHQKKNKSTGVSKTPVAPSVAHVGYYGGPIAIHHVPAQPRKLVFDPFASMLLG